MVSGHALLLLRVRVDGSGWQMGKGRVGARHERPAGWRGMALLFPPSLPDTFSLSARALASTALLCPEDEEACLRWRDG